MSAIDAPILNTPFQIIGQQQTVEIASPTLIRDVVEVTVVEVPHGVVFVVRVPRQDWLDGLTAIFVSSYVDEVWIIMNQPFVEDADFVQSVNAAGHIIDYLDIVVSPDGGDSSAILHQPFARLDFAIVGPLIDALATNLSTVAALT